MNKIVLRPVAQSRRGSEIDARRDPNDVRSRCRFFLDCQRRMRSHPFRGRCSVALLRRSLQSNFRTGHAGARRGARSGETPSAGITIPRLLGDRCHRSPAPLFLPVRGLFCFSFIFRRSFQTCRQHCGRPDRKRKCSRETMTQTASTTDTHKQTRKITKLL